MNYEVIRGEATIWNLGGKVGKKKGGAKLKIKKLGVNFNLKKKLRKTW
jgi:hypothetical protein